MREDARSVVKGDQGKLSRYLHEPINIDQVDDRLKHVERVMTKKMDTYNSEKEEAAENTSGVTFNCRLRFEHQHTCLNWGITAHDEIECIMDSDAQNGVEEPHATTPKRKQQACTAPTDH